MQSRYPDKKIIITNGEFIKREFRLFFALYNNGTMRPRIKEQSVAEEAAVK